MAYETEVASRYNPQLRAVVTERRPMGGPHAGVSVSLMTGDRGTSIDLDDDEALELAHAIREAVQQDP